MSARFQQALGTHCLGTACLSTAQPDPRQLGFAAGWMYFLMGMIFGCGIGEVINLCGECSRTMHLGCLA